MWPLFFVCVEQRVCPQQAAIAGQSRINCSGTSRSLVPWVFSAELMMFHTSQSQHWQPLLSVTSCSSHCIPSLVLGQFWCDSAAEGASNSSAPQIARVGHEGFLIWGLFPA